MELRRVMTSGPKVGRRRATPPMGPADDAMGDIEGLDATAGAHDIDALVDRMVERHARLAPSRCARLSAQRSMGASRTTRRSCGCSPRSAPRQRAAELGSGEPSGRRSEHSSRGLPVRARVTRVSTGPLCAGRGGADAPEAASAAERHERGSRGGDASANDARASSKSPRRIGDLARTKFAPADPRRLLIGPRSNGVEGSWILVDPRFATGRRSWILVEARFGTGRRSWILVRPSSWSGRHTSELGRSKFERGRGLSDLGPTKIERRSRSRILVDPRIPIFFGTGGVLEPRALL